MIANPACAERGCACHDYRDGSGVEMMRREWVGLTDEEAKAVNFPKPGVCYVYPSDWEEVGLPFVRAIEAKLKEKNT